MIMGWGLDAAQKPNEPEQNSMAAALARTQLAPAALTPLPQRANTALTRKKTFLEEMLRKFKNGSPGGKRAA